MINESKDFQNYVLFNTQNAKFGIQFEPVIRIYDLTLSFFGTSGKRCKLSEIISVVLTLPRIWSYLMIQNRNHSMKVSTTNKTKVKHCL